MSQNHLKVSHDISEPLSGKKFKVNSISNNASCGCKSGLSSENDSETIFLVLSKLINVLDPSPPAKEVANGINGSPNFNVVANTEIPASEATSNINPALKTFNNSTDNHGYTNDASYSANGIVAPELQTNTDTWAEDANAMEVAWSCESNIIQMDSPNNEVTIATPIDIPSDGIKEASNSETSADREASDMDVTEIQDNSAEIALCVDSNSKKDSSSNNIEDEMNESFRVDISSDEDDVIDMSLYSGINDAESGNEDLNDVDMDNNRNRNEDNVTVENVDMESDCIDLEATSEAPEAERNIMHLNKTNQVQSAVEADAATNFIASQADNCELIDLTLSSPPGSPLAASRPIQLQPSPKVKILPQESQENCLAINVQVSPIQDDSDRNLKSELASRQVPSLQPAALSNHIPNPLHIPLYSEPPSVEARAHQTPKDFQDNPLQSANGGYPGFPFQTQCLTSQSQSEYGDSNAQLRDFSFYSNNPGADQSKPYIPVQSPVPGAQAVIQNQNYNAYASASQQPQSTPTLPLSPHTMTSFAAHAASFPMPSGYNTPIVIQNIFVFPSAPPSNNQRP